jgi:hypothetical protein
LAPGPDHQQQQQPHSSGSDFHVRRSKELINPLQHATISTWLVFQFPTLRKNDSNCMGDHIIAHIFLVAYSSSINLTTGVVRSAEVLARMYQSTRR